MGKKLFNYKAFGLSFSSEIEIPEFLQSDSGDDAIIRFGKVPDKLKNITKKGVLFESNSNEFILNVNNVGRFFIENGNRITIEKSLNSTEDEIRLFLLGSSMGALLYQKGLIPIHGSSIDSGKSAVIFSGISGVGKSTIASAFHKKGYKLITDDVCVVNKKNEKPFIQPGYPQLKLWEDILKKFNNEDTKKRKLRPSIEKYGISINYNFNDTEKEVKRIFILSTKNTKGVEVEEIKGFQKFNALKNNTYRYQFISDNDQKKKHFEIIDSLIKNSRIYYIKRPSGVYEIEELTNKIEPLFNE